MTQKEYVRLESRKQLARQVFYDYCKTMYPKFYTEDRVYLKELCERLQSFTEQNEKRFLVINVPPRHGKSFTAKNFTEWLFGRDSLTKVMTGSYNETLSTMFAKQVRSTIEEKTAGARLVYNDIFPYSKVQYGEASASIWSLEGAKQKSYLATSPTGTATGFGANYIMIDDIIKNAEEAYNDSVLEKHFSWFANTMLSRTEGDDWKVILIMTRWATNDLAGRILDSYEDIEHIDFSAVKEDGSMLCDSILNHNDYLLKTKEMNPDIVEANYNQKPIDIKGRLFNEFLVWDTLPQGEHSKFNITDTADTGSDFLCSVDYISVDGDVFITDVYISDEPMEITEPKLATMLIDDDVDLATFESNNGGRGFARNIERILKERKHYKCVITDEVQTKNKESRILTSSAWVNKHIFMPINWKSKYPEFYNQLFKYQSKGKNKNDDAPDCVASIYEKVANEQEIEYAGVR